jgi:hypothetical protein
MKTDAHNIRKNWAMNWSALSDFELFASFSSFQRLAAL